MHGFPPINPSDLPELPASHEAESGSSVTESGSDAVTSPWPGLVGPSPGENHQTADCGWHAGF